MIEQRNHFLVYVYYIESCNLDKKNWPSANWTPRVQIMFFWGVMISLALGLPFNSACFMRLTMRNSYSFIHVTDRKRSEHLRVPNPYLTYLLACGFLKLLPIKMLEQKQIKITKTHLTFSSLKVNYYDHVIFDGFFFPIH